MSTSSSPAPTRRGLMLILSSPSGAGKTTLTRNLLADETLGLVLSVSVTTRPRRSSEINGVHYHFLNTKREFERMVEDDDLLEWAEVHGNFYGTPRAWVESELAQGRDVLFDIDYQGTMQVREKAEADVVTVFILPPSMRELRARLVRRAEDTDSVIQQRLLASRNEIERWRLYDYVVINDDIQNAFDKVKAILMAERLKRTRDEKTIQAFVDKLLAEAVF